MSIPQNIFLVGPMGAGKSTVGQMLAKQLHKQFLDSDKEIEKRTGVTISHIFDVEGEEGFRKREKKVIDELSQETNLVLATGGGVVLTPENRSVLMSRGYVVYLKASLDLLIERTSRNRNRPLLDVEDPENKMIELMKLREPLYEDVADMVIETDRNNVRYVVKEIETRLETI